MENRMRKTKFLTVTIILYILLYIFLKLFIVYIDDLFMNNEIYENEYGLAKVLKVKKYSELEKNNTDYFIGKNDEYNIEIKDYFAGFEPGDKDKNYEYHLLYNDENNIEAAFMIGKFATRLSTINSYDEDSYYYEFNHFPLYISKMLRNHFLEKNKIENDIDLVKHIREREKIESNFFTPIITLKENYFYNFVETTLPDLTTVTYIEGDYEGIMYESSNTKQACIIKDDNLYCITFYKLDYFTDSMIEDILNSLIIK